MNNRRLTVKNLMISVVGACLLMAALRQSWGVWATGILPISALVVAFICRYRWREMRSVPGVAVISIPALALLCMAFLGGPGWEVSIAFAVSYEMIALAAWTAWTKRGGLSGIRRDRRRLFARLPAALPQLPGLALLPVHRTDPG